MERNHNHGFWGVGHHRIFRFRRTDCTRGRQGCQPAATQHSSHLEEKRNADVTKRDPRANTCGSRFILSTNPTHSNLADGPLSDIL